MKKSSIILVLILVFGFVKSSASSMLNSEKTELTKQMANSEQFKLLIRNSLSLNISHAMLGSYPSTDAVELRSEYKKLVENNIEYKKRVDLEFPQFQTLNEVERIEIVENILSTTMYQSWLTCFGNKLLNLAIAVGIPAGSIKATYFLYCSTATIAADVAVTAAAPVNAAVIVEEVAAEVGFCAYFAGGTVTAAVIAPAVYGFITALNDCRI